MSRTQDGTKCIFRHIIVRAFDDAPMMLKGRALGDASVEVAGAERNIRVSAKDAYQFDKSLFERLSAAYDQSNVSGLKDGWRTAVPLVSSYHPTG